MNKVRTRDELIRQNAGIAGVGGAAVYGACTAIFGLAGLLLTGVGAAAVVPFLTTAILGVAVCGIVAAVAGGLIGSLTDYSINEGKRIPFDDKGHRATPSPVQHPPEVPAPVMACDTAPQQPTTRYQDQVIQSRANQEVSQEKQC